MASSTNIHGFNIGGNNNSFDQRGHFYRAFLSGNVSGMLVKQNSTPNMTVLVEHGSALLNKNTISASVAEIKSDVSVTIDTANTANPRIDSVVIYEDTSVAIPTVEASYWQDGAGGRFKIVSLPGTAASSPTALTDANIQSAIGAGKPFARLAYITVAANSTTILNSNINNSVRSKLGVSIANLNGAVTVDKIDTASFPKFKASRAAALNFPRSATTIFAVDTVEHNVGGGTLSGGRYTVPISGKYAVKSKFLLLDTPVSGWAVLYINGAAYSYQDFAGGLNYPTLKVNTTVTVSAGDIIDIRFLNEQTTRDPVISTDTSNPIQVRSNELCIDYLV